MARKRSSTVQVWATLPEDLHGQMQELIVRRGLSNIRNPEGLIIIEALVAFFAPAPVAPVATPTPPPLDDLDFDPTQV